MQLLRKFSSRLTVIFAVILMFSAFIAPEPIAAFEPDFHAEITSTALKNNQIHGQGMTFTDSAIKQIQDANIGEDCVPLCQLQASIHFDDESFFNSSLRLINLKRLVISFLLISPNPSGSYARRLLGQALHTVQDFYSHTNWVEMTIAGKRNGINADLGQRTIPNPPPSLNTRDPSNLSDPAGSYNANLDQLTSGYFTIRLNLSTSLCTAPPGKTRHGVDHLVIPDSIRHTITVINCPGLNKDWPDNHTDLSRRKYNLAHDLAVEASVDFINQILNDPRVSGNAAAIKALMGIDGSNPPPTLITLSPNSLSDGIAGTAYSASITASGGATPYTFAVTSGTLPRGLTLSSSGLLSGTPTAAEDKTFTITATDANGFTGSKAYSIHIAAPIITLSPASLPNGTAGTAYSASITASGGATPYTFAVTTGLLSDGLTLSSNGTLSGTIAAAAANQTFGFTITATDANGFTGSRSYSIAVAAPIIILSPTTLPDGRAGDPYNQLITASGGTAPYTFTLTGGALPDGLTLGSDGTISGTPSDQAGGQTYGFTITATDANGFTGAIGYSLVIKPLLTQDFTNTVTLICHTFYELWTTTYRAGIPIHTHYVLTYGLGDVRPIAIIDTDGDRPQRPPINHTCEFFNPVTVLGYTYYESWQTDYTDETPIATRYWLRDTLGNTLNYIETAGDRPPRPPIINVFHENYNYYGTQDGELYTDSWILTYTDDALTDTQCSSSHQPFVVYVDPNSLPPWPGSCISRPGH